MTTLSWLLYLAGVFDALKNIAGPAAFLSFFAALVAIIGRVVWVCVSAIFIVVPSAQTIYAVAAVQVGEKFVKTEFASDAQKALQNWIKKQLQ